MSDVVQTLWGFCHSLRHEGVDYGDYIEQLTYLLFLKMADEKAIDLSAVPFTTPEQKQIDLDCSWPALRELDGTVLLDHYQDALRALGKQTGILGAIFAGAQSRFTRPVTLKGLLSKIDETEWTELDTDVKADAFEGLLEKAASEGKKGAGQYFTPRVLIRSIVRCMRPDPRAHTEFTICDPACGTGGFLLMAYEWLMKATGGALDRDTSRRIRSRTYFGQELVARPRRLALMNMYLHGLEPEIALHDSIYDQPHRRDFDLILTNPPFGTKGANDVPHRDDFMVETTNKQLNFLQHVMTVLRPGGRAAVVLPDNCLFADNAGDVFSYLVQDCDLHTVLRLPRGTFSPYSPGTQTNVVFFTKGTPTLTTWIYDARTNVPAFTKKERVLSPAAFETFEECYGADPNGRTHRRSDGSDEDRWRPFTIGEVRERDYKLDSLRWLREESLDDTEGVVEPETLASDAIGELESAIEELNAVIRLLENGVVEEPAISGAGG